MAIEGEKMGGESKAKAASRKELLALLRRQQFRCALSGAEITPEDAEIDHVVPESKGGNHAIDNLQIVHVRVNRMKGQMTQDEFVEWCSRVATTGGIEGTGKSLIN